MEKFLLKWLYLFTLTIYTIIFFIVILFHNKKLFHFIEIVLLANYLYIFIPLLIFLVYAKTIKSKLLPLQMQVKKFNQFIVLIPAHNKSGVLPVLLKSIKNQDYPSRFFDTVVIADNCTDDTAAIARQLEATCYERQTPIRSNKGKCIHFACEQLINSGLPQDAYIVIVDSDCEMSIDFLSEVNKKLNSPGGPQILQSYRYVKNSLESILATLESASEIIRQLISLGTRDILKLSGFLHGSGMVFRNDIFFAVCSNAEKSLAEDKEWNANLLKMGMKVGWCPSAKLCYTVYASNKDFQTQRKRWIVGQFVNAKKYALNSLWRGIKQFNLSQIDFAFHLSKLPRTILLSLSLICCFVNYIFFDSLSFSVLWLALCFLMVGYGFIALGISGIKFNYIDLAKTGSKMIFGITKTMLFNLFNMKSTTWTSNRNQSI